VNPDPVALHVATELPLQPTAFGVQTCGLQEPEGASQYCVAVHVATTWDDAP
jgi:hypothetical protein